MNARILAPVTVLLGALLWSGCVQTIHMGKIPVVAGRALKIKGEKGKPKVSGQACTSLFFASESDPGNLQHAYEQALDVAGEPYNALINVEAMPSGFSVMFGSNVIYRRACVEVRGTPVVLEAAAPEPPPQAAPPAAPDAPPGAAAPPPADGATTGTQANTPQDNATQDNGDQPKKKKKKSHKKEQEEEDDGPPQKMSERGGKTYFGGALVGIGFIPLAVGGLACLAGFPLLILYGAGVLVWAFGCLNLAAAAGLIGSGLGLVYMDRPMFVDDVEEAPKEKAAKEQAAPAASTPSTSPPPPAQDNAVPPADPAPAPSASPAPAAESAPPAASDGADANPPPAEAAAPVPPPAPEPTADATAEPEEKAAGGKRAKGKKKGKKK